MKKIYSAALALLLVLSLFAGCAKEQPAAEDPGTNETDLPEVTIRLASLKGPTTMGLVKLIDDASKGGTAYNLESGLYGAADEVSGLIVQGSVDIAAIPANLAATLYNKTQGAIRVAAINTLGVLYVLEIGDSVQSVADLKGKTVYSTGKGTTPEYVLNTLLIKNGLDPASDLTVEFLSEATEVAAQLAAAGEGAVAVLPQPFVTSVLAQNADARVALDITKECQSSVGETLVTGVVVISAAFLESSPEAVAAFLADYRASTDWVNANPAEAGVLIADLEIVAKAELAEKAIPGCNITYIDGDEMQRAVSSYLQALFDQDPKSVGGTMPDEAFYWKK